MHIEQEPPGRFPYGRRLAVLHRHRRVHGNLVKRHARPGRFDENFGTKHCAALVEPQVFDDRQGINAQGAAGIPQVPPGLHLEPEPGPSPPDPFPAPAGSQGRRPPANDQGVGMGLTGRHHFLNVRHDRRRPLPQHHEVGGLKGPGAGGGGSQMGP